MIIYPLSEGQFTVDQTKAFVPFDASQHQLTERPTGSLLVEIQPFVVITATDVILLDAGLGYTLGGELQIHRQLKAVGVQPDQVTKVILSHLHKDHIGGIAHSATAALLPGATDWRPSFPNATYYVQREELNYASLASSASYLPSLLQWLSAYEKLVLLDGATQISQTIRCELSCGHCPYHQVIWITEGDQIIFYGGDEAPQLQQMKHRFVAKYDKDGKKAMQLRATWWQLSEQENWTFLFYHDLAHAIYRR
jgi:glyoxylase-like metal-dependent hydrolase (beta-lactamase superfamily II)